MMHFGNGDKPSNITQRQMKRNQAFKLLDIHYTAKYIRMLNYQSITYKKTTVLCEYSKF